MLVFGPKLNRSYTFYVPFMSTNVQISVMFHKLNCCLGFNVDQRIYQMQRDNELTSYIYKDLNESVFATTFLDLKSFSSRNLDIKLQFNDILPQFKSEIVYKYNESIKISKVKTQNGEFKSCLYVYIFGFQTYGNEFLFFLAERQHIDIALDKKVCRSYGLQLCSKNRMEDFLQTVDYHNNNAVKNDTVDKSMESIFTSKQNVNIRRF